MRGAPDLGQGRVVTRIPREGEQVAGAAALVIHSEPCKLIDVARKSFCE